MSAERMDATFPASPRMISHYRLVELRGRGAMGEVWLAEDTQLPRRVAIKLLPPHLSEDPEAVNRLLREAQATASIDHPAVVTVYEAGQVDGRPYLVMQLLDGETLAQRLERGALPIHESLELARRLTDALAEVHALGIVHRDLKPSNIIVTERGAKILDFGIASIRSLPGLTAAGDVLGTPMAMSPEQVRGLPPDNRSDLWALGVVLYQALAGRPPFSGAAREAVFQQVLHYQPEPPSRLRPEVPAELDHIVMKLLRKDPAHRYPRAEDLLADLASCAEQLGPVDSTQAARTAPSSPAVPGLAVLRFELLSPDPDDAFLAAGLVEDLIVDLSRLQALRVASRGETAAYGERNVPPRTLARELGVDFVLTGSVRRQGNRTRISAQLVRAADGHVVWGGRFDRTLEDLFDVQAEVSRQIVDALQLALRPGEREMLDRAPTKNPEAYRLYLRGRDLLNKTRDDNLRAERLLRQAVELDPDFALGHAALGECFAHRGLSWWSGREVAEPAMASVRRALEIEPGLPDAHNVELMLRRLEGDPARVLESIERVLALNPEDGQALEWAAWSYMALGKPAQALPILESLVDRQPDRYMSTAFLCNCYEMLGKNDASLRQTRLLVERLVEIVRRNPDAVHQRSLLGSLLVQLGQAEEGIAQVERAVALAPNDGRILYNAACTYGRAGQVDKAIAYIQDALKNLPTYLADWPRNDPDLVNVRSHPEFVRLFGPAT